ncbi:hypothetical protein LTR17_025510 [Elasticomyces elasticus]|nr:hypothetical protein LTR17_025510 [Elasticomyces elasticus]
MAAQQAPAIACDQDTDDCNKTPHQRNHVAGFLPAPSGGVQALRWYSSVFEKGAAASAFLGGTLLSVTTGAPDQKLDSVRSAAAGGATLFLILFLLCLGLPLFFEFHSQEIVRILEEPKAVLPKSGYPETNWQSAQYHAGLAGLSFILQALALSGTACVFQVMIPFAKPAGWAGFVVTLVLAAGTLLVWSLKTVEWLAAIEKDKRELAR